MLPQIGGFLPGLRYNFYHTVDGKREFFNYSIFKVLEFTQFWYITLRNVFKLRLSKESRQVFHSEPKYYLKTQNHCRRL